MNLLFTALLAFGLFFALCAADLVAYWGDRR